MSVVLDNIDVVRHAGGRPPAYKSANEMQLVIDAFFKECQGEILKDNDGITVFDKYGQPVMINQHPPTVTGLALALGFTTRMALLNYQGKEEFVDTIKRAKSKIEQYAEARLFDRDGVNGAKFSLINNFTGWRESQSIEVTGANGGPIEVASVTQLSDADLIQLVDLLQKAQLPAPEIVDI